MKRRRAKKSDARTVQGFYIQAMRPDENPEKSEGIYIETGDLKADDVAGLTPGYKVCLQGTVDEVFGNTLVDISNDNTQYSVTENVGVPEAIELAVNAGETLPHALERYEGMKVRLTANTDMRVTRNFGFDYCAYRNNMVLSRHAPLIKPTQLYPPESQQAAALQKENARNQLYVDSDLNPEAGKLPYRPSFNPETGYIRTGDTVTGLEGVIYYSYGKYRLIPTNEISEGDFIRDTDRTDAPESADEGDIRIAGFNVLNFFNSVLDGAAKNPLGQNRGAAKVEEFEKQRIKIVNAITGMNADIVGLIEIENNGFGENSAIQNLLDAVNDKIKDTGSRYSFIAAADELPIGSDAITVGLFYRPGKVIPQGDMIEITMPKQEFTFKGVKSGKEPRDFAVVKGQRDSLLQKFKVAAGGDVKEGAEFTLVVNHLKSKGSRCKEDYDEYVSPVPLTPKEKIDTRKAEHKAGYSDDLQGSCNNFRVAAATRLGDYLKEHVSGDILLLGDFNAYGQEDPVKVLTDYDAKASGARQITAAGNTTVDDKPLYASPAPVTQNYG